MLLGIDLGNTNITIGVFEKNVLIGTFRMTTKQPRTSDEIGIFICDLLNQLNIETSQIEAVIVASVVPDMMYSLNSAIIKYFDKKPLIVSSDIFTGITVKTEQPGHLGADRLVDAAAAYAYYGGPVIVVDFGTATTYDVVLADGSFVGGVITPGLQTAANSLSDSTARLPKIAIEKPKNILAKNTITSIQAGVVYGYIGQTEYIIKNLKKEANVADIKVVATGGLGAMIAQETDSIDYYDRDLTLKGLQFIYERNK